MGDEKGSALRTSALPPSLSVSVREATPIGCPQVPFRPLPLPQARTGVPKPTPTPLSIPSGLLDWLVPRLYIFRAKMDNNSASRLDASGGFCVLKTCGIGPPRRGSNAVCVGVSHAQSGAVLVRAAGL